MELLSDEVMEKALFTLCHSHEKENRERERSLFKTIASFDREVLQQVVRCVTSNRAYRGFQDDVQR
jgi:hypothetical protein